MILAAFVEASRSKVTSDWRTAAFASDASSVILNLERPAAMASAITKGNIVYWASRARKWRDAFSASDITNLSNARDASNESE